MNRGIRTGIVATLGPASHTYTVIAKLAKAGVNIFRLNCSHSSDAERIHRIDAIRKLRKKGYPELKVLLDLEGPRIRTGRLKNGKTVSLKKGSQLILTEEPILGNAKKVHIDYKGLSRVVSKGHPIFIADGSIHLEVVSTRKKEVITRVIIGGLLGEHKGVNLPSTKVPFKSPTAKDERDILFGITHGVDMLAQSFVCSPEDIRRIRQIISSHNFRCPLIAKIESRDGIHAIDEIINVCDGIMVARGDMGVSVPIYEIPIIQKQIIKKCNNKRKFVITATEMLEHMVEHRRPTRAEVTDIANAIFDGTNYVMLSAETAAGKYPVEAVTMMREVIEFTERSSIYKKSKLG